jgi:hypothetical protein
MFGLPPSIGVLPGGLFTLPASAPLAPTPKSDGTGRNREQWAEPVGLARGRAKLGADV